VLVSAEAAAAIRRLLSAVEQPTGDLTDEQAIFDLAAEHEANRNGLFGPVTFDATGLLDFARAIERAAIAAHLAQHPKAEQPVLTQAALEEQVKIWFPDRAYQAPFFARTYFTRIAPDAVHLARQAQAEPTEEMARFCPHCASIGEVGAQYRDCCPDGSAARIVPKRLAEVCRDTFKLAISNVAAPAAPAGAQNALPLLAAQLEQIAQSWDECHCDGIGEDRSIGAVLREDFARLVNLSDAPAGAQNALTIGEAFKAVGGWMSGGELGYPSFGSMNALWAYTVKMIRAYTEGHSASAQNAEAIRNQALTDVELVAIEALLDCIESNDTVNARQMRVLYKAHLATARQGLDRALQTGSATSSNGGAA
jgi:hypothetical protein